MSSKTIRSDLRSFGDQIAARRRRLGKTQANVADELGMTTAYVSLLERGLRNPPYTTVVALARALEVPVAKLLAR